jgi:hypothetical protein
MAAIEREDGDREWPFEDRLSGWAALPICLKPEWRMFRERRRA